MRVCVFLGVHTLECLVSWLFMLFMCQEFGILAIVQENEWETPKWMVKLNMAEYSKGELMLGINLEG